MDDEEASLDAWQHSLEAFLPSEAASKLRKSAANYSPANPLEVLYCAAQEGALRQKLKLHGEHVT